MVNVTFLSLSSTESMVCSNLADEKELRAQMETTAKNSFLSLDDIMNLIYFSV